MKKKLSFILAMSGCIFMVLCGISSCKSNQFTDAADCAVMTRDQVVSAWEGGGYLDQIDSILIFTIYGGPGSEADTKVRVFGEKSDGAIISGTRVELTKGTSCTVNLGPDVNYVRNQVKLADLNIIEGKKVKDFNYIRFVPITRDYQGEKYLAYDVVVIVDGKPMPGKWSDPCPPLCPPFFDSDKVVTDPLPQQKDTSTHK